MNHDPELLAALARCTADAVETSSTRPNGFVLSFLVDEVVHTVYSWPPVCQHQAADRAMSIVAELLTADGAPDPAQGG